MLNTFDDFIALAQTDARAALTPEQLTPNIQPQNRKHEYLCPIQTATQTTKRYLGQD